MLSVIIPNHNGARTIDGCLEHVLNSDHGDYEVIVVDDASSDDSVARIRKYESCRLFQMTEWGGASRARNLGARQARGKILLFIDADCLVQADTLRVAEAAAHRLGQDVVVGGAYAPRPADPGFFNTFQSVFIHHSETRHERPDYIASHAMVIHARTFHEQGGFSEDFLPILEDVEFSHRLRRNGVRLVMEPGLLVQHVFNFNMFRSLANAQRKTRYWVRYSLDNKDLLADSGTASRELKLNALFLGLSLLLVLLGLVGSWSLALLGAGMAQGLNAWVQKDMFRAFFRTKGAVFALAAAGYYTVIYPWAILVGGLFGLGTSYRRRRSRLLGCSRQTEESRPTYEPSSRLLPSSPGTAPLNREIT